MKKGTCIDLTGRVFGKIKILSFNSVTKQGSLWNALCECGTAFIVRGIHAKNGHTTSCGCVGRSRLGRRITHGLSKTPEYKLWKEAKTRSKKLGRRFNLEISDIRIPEICPLLRIPLFRGVGKVCPNSPSVDCIRPELGYIKGNIWVISYRANTTKSDYSLQQLKDFVNTLSYKMEE